MPLSEVDLKRPGRVDVKIPLFPTATPVESYALIRALARRRGVVLPDALPPAPPEMPELLTPGAAEALAVKLYRTIKTDNVTPEQALTIALRDYQPPVRHEILAAQIQLAVSEATDLSFVPERFRST